jgi:hypothetical protein
MNRTYGEFYPRVSQAETYNRIELRPTDARRTARSLDAAAKHCWETYHERTKRPRPHARQSGENEEVGNQSGEKGRSGGTHRADACHSSHGTFEFRDLSSSDGDVGVLRDVANALGGPRVSGRDGPFGSEGAVGRYLIAGPEAAVETGCYRYCPEHHALARLGQLDVAFEEVLRWTVGEDSPESVKYVLSISGVFAHLAPEFGAASYRYALLAAGRIAGNVRSILSDRDVPVAHQYRFNDRQLNRRLGINGVDEAILQTIAIEGYDD